MISHWPNYADQSKKLLPVIIIMMLFGINPACILSQDSEADSLIELLKQDLSEEEQLDLNYNIADKLNWQDFQRSRPYIKNAIRLAKKLNKQEKLGYSYMHYMENLNSQHLDMNAADDSTEHYLSLANEAFIKAHSKGGQAEILAERGYIAEFKGDFMTSMDYFVQASKIFDEIDATNNYIVNQLNIAGLFSSMSQYDEGLKQIAKTRAIPGFNSSNINIAFCYIIEGEIFKRTGRRDSAIAVYNKLQKIAKEEEFYNDIISSSVHLGDLFLQKNEIEKAEEYYNLAMEYIETFQDEYFVALTRQGMGKLHIAKKEFNEAVTYLEQAKSLLDVPTYKFLRNDIYKDLASAYVGLEDFKQAHYYQDLYARIQDSIYENRSTRIAAETEARYQTEKKEKELDQKKSEQRLLIIMSSLLLIVALSLLWAFRQKLRINKVLADKNEEKEFLIKEIHHRVKNNLQIISSLLNLQSKSIDNQDAVHAVVEGRNRVQSMSLIHQKLYMGDNIVGVNMQAYVEDLARHLLDSFGLDDGNVSIQTNITCPDLDVDTAIPLGLIINELVTNSCKYAFPNRRTGTINVNLSLSEHDHLLLQIQDNGVGSRSATSDNKGTHFGQNMVNILSKKLKGEISQEISKSGYKTTILFNRFKLSN